MTLSSGTVLSAAGLLPVFESADPYVIQHLLRVFLRAPTHQVSRVSLLSCATTGAVCSTIDRKRKAHSPCPPALMLHEHAITLGIEED